MKRAQMVTGTMPHAGGAEIEGSWVVLFCFLLWVMCQMYVVGQNIVHRDPQPTRPGREAGAPPPPPLPSAPVERQAPAPRIEEPESESVLSAMVR